MLLDSSFINLTTNATTTIEKVTYSNIISVIRITLVLISRGGFILIQTGSIPTECTSDIILQNIVEFAITTASYGLIGVLLSFGGESYNGFVGYGSWDYAEITCDNIIFGFSLVIMGSAIITTFLAGRLHFFGYIFIAFTYSGFTQPIIMHWIWHKRGWMNNYNLLNHIVKMYDHAGSLPVHISSSLIGILGMTFLGRRLLRLDDIDESSLGSDSPITIFLGYVLLAVGLFGLSMPYKQPDLFHENGYLGLVLINNVLGLSGGATAAVILEFVLWRASFNYWVLIRLLQGGISGLVILSSSINYCYPPASFAVAFIGGTLATCMSKLIFKTALEDYCNIISIHLFGGFWSPLLQPFVARIRTMTLIELFWQGICTFVIMFCIFVIYSVLFSMLYCSGFLRSNVERNCHNRSLRAVKDSECPLSRLFVLADFDDILEPGVSGKTPNVSVLPNTDLLTLFTNTNAGTSGRTKSRNLDSGSKDVSKRVEYDQSSQDIFNLSPKAKNIYTIHNIMTNKETPSFQKMKENVNIQGDVGDCDCSGSGVFKLDDLISSQDNIGTKCGKSDIVSKLKIKQKLSKKRSHIKLSKSKRYLDFSTQKVLKKKSKNKNNAMVNIYINRSSELIAYDKKYNDDITTYKIPRFLEYISD